MERGLTLLVAALVAHLSFSNAAVDITRSGCGVNKLCLATPDDCAPDGTGECLFASVVAAAPMAPNGAMLSIELRGDSAGYIALGLTANASTGTTLLFACGTIISDTRLFTTRTLNNTDATLTRNMEPVTDSRVMITGNVIKCKFNITSVNATRSRSSQATTSSILLGSGGTSGTLLGAFKLALNSGPLNLADPASNLVRTTTAAPSVRTTTATPSVGGTTAAPSVGGTTAAPSVGGTTAAPSVGGTTAAPSVGGTTAAPSVGGTTAAPSVGGTTAAPSVGGTTAAPSVGGTTAAPSVGGTTAAPSVGGTTAAPSVGGTTAAPSVGGTTAAPSVGGTTAAPSVGGTTAAPSVGGAVQPHAVLLLLSVLSLAVMLREGSCG